VKLIQAKLKEVVRFKPVEKKDKFLMALIIALKVLLTRKYESIKI
jgi:hypothetical protein